MPRDTDVHLRHDPLDVVALAAGDLTGTDRQRAATLVADCPHCARLHDDLVAVARATAALPAARRSRDFRLTPADAARLRPMGWRRFVAAFAAPRLAFTRQLGVGLTTLGLAGLLFTVLPGIPLSMGSAASAPSAAPAMELQTDQSLSAPYGGAPGATSAPSAGDAQAGGLENTQRPIGVAGAPGASQPTAVDNGQSTGRTSATGDLGGDGTVATNIPPLAIGSGIALAIGLALLLARRLGRSVANR